MPLRGIIFDLDGTLADTLPVCFAAFRRAFIETTGREYTDREIERMFGPTEEGAIRKVVPEADWDAALNAFYDAYEQAHAPCRAPFPGVEDLLRRLQAKGIRLAVVTGKGARSAAISMRHIGLTAYFDVVEAGSAEGPIKSQAIRKVLALWGQPAEEVAYVGDALSDVRSAREAGVIPLSAAWADTADYDRLEAMRPAATFRTVADLADWLDSALEEDKAAP
jgi:HAD superfamily hydrolase (TIGR01549 family)